MNRSIATMKYVMLVTFLSLMMTACNEGNETPVAQPLLEVKVSSPVEHKIVEWDEYTGRFRAMEEVDVRARVSGYLDEIKFKDGHIVQKGDVLFVIDQRPFKIALKSAEAQFELSKKEYERASLLRKNGASSQENLDRRVQELKAAEAALERAKLDMEFTEVKAPISGRVSRDLVNAGNLVNGGDLNATVLTRIVSINPIHFYFEVSERNALKYLRLDKSGEREGSRTKANPVEVNLQDETDFPHKGAMDFVDNRSDPSTGTIQGRAIIPNQDGFIQPGLFGRARLLGSGEYIAMLIPDVLIGSDQAHKFVYVVNDDNVVEIRNITLGPLYQGSWRIVRGGLEISDRIVAKAIQRVRPGITIEPKEIDLIEEYGMEEAGLLSALPSALKDSIGGEEE